ncbi:hypothetical protein AB0H34_32770 [Saccharopolyspora shandongensis]|uniref:hypothetical protein n=1 Tax=Saccharopolyspora shandongensis TaxID=418495 RepID=UPI0033E6A830
MTTINRVPPPIASVKTDDPNTARWKSTPRPDRPIHLIAMGYTRLRYTSHGYARYTAYYWDLRGRQRSAGTFARQRDANRTWRRAEAQITADPWTTMLISGSYSGTPESSNGPGARGADQRYWSAVPHRRSVIRVRLVQ